MYIYVYILGAREERKTSTYFCRNPELGKLPKPLTGSDIQEIPEPRIQNTPWYWRPSNLSMCGSVCLFITVTLQHWICSDYFTLYHGNLFHCRIQNSFCIPPPPFKCPFQASSDYVIVTFFCVCMKIFTRPK